MLTLLLVSVYKLLLNYFHQLLLRPHLHPERANVPGSRPTIFRLPLLSHVGLACWQDLHFRRRQTFHLHCFCLCLSTMSKPCTTPHSSLAPRLLDPHMNLVRRVQFHCSSGAKVDLLFGGVREDFYNFCVSFCLVFHFVWLSISKFSCLCYCLSPPYPSPPQKHIENIPCPFGSSSWLQISFMTLTWLNDLFIQTFLT